jgi:UDPglucose 6-dehydrogenase
LTIKKYKITVVGSGYVGLSLSVLLAQHNNVVVTDIDKSRIKKINNKESTVEDNEIKDFLVNKNLMLTATTDFKKAILDSDFIIIATPTNYDEDSNYFDTSSVDEVVESSIKFNKNAEIFIKSTLPIGHTNFLNKKHSTNKIVFSPEFLREGSALKDNLYPSRIIIGSKSKSAKIFCDLLCQGALKKNIDKLFINSSEAESIKLFSNTYLAMRISFFNELDSFAETNSLDTRSIIDGISLDKRIGDGYNNPSFGYGGYCLPKDTKQLKANYEAVPQSIVKAIISSNDLRKDFVANQILKSKPSVIGFYRLIMKEGRDNFRASAIYGIMERVNRDAIEIVIYEPLLNDDSHMGYKVIRDIEEFKNYSDIIVANRLDNKISDVRSKIYSRDLYNEN